MYLRLNFESGYRFAVFLINLSEKTCYCIKNHHSPFEDKSRRFRWLNPLGRERRGRGALPLEIPTPCLVDIDKNITQGVGCKIPGKIELHKKKITGLHVVYLKSILPFWKNFTYFLQRVYDYQWSIKIYCFDDLHLQPAIWCVHKMDQICKKRKQMAITF